MGAEIAASANKKKQLRFAWCEREPVAYNCLFAHIEIRGNFECR